MSTTTGPPNPDDGTLDPCLKALYQAQEPAEFFRLYYEALLAEYFQTSDPHKLFEAGFIRKYSTQISDPQTVKCSKRVHTQLRKFVGELDPALQGDIEGRYKAAISAINKARRNISHIEKVLDIVAFRVILYGPFSEQELVSFCYQYLNKVCTHFISKGFTLCESSPVSGTLDKESETYKKMIHPTPSDLDSIKWLGPLRVKDYIESPKKNTYSRIHLALMAPNGYTFELQICTMASHVRAEEGDPLDTTGTLDHTSYKLDKYKNGIICDPTRISMPGFTTSMDPNGQLILHDHIGILIPKKIVV